jgi:hypothetical protein
MQFSAKAALQQVQRATCFKHCAKTQISKATSAETVHINPAGTDVGITKHTLRPAHSRHISCRQLYALGIAQTHLKPVVTWQGARVLLSPLGCGGTFTATTQRLIPDLASTWLRLHASAPLCTHCTATSTTLSAMSATSVLLPAVLLEVLLAATLLGAP